MIRRCIKPLYLTGLLVVPCGPLSADTDRTLEALHIIDGHVHVAGLGYGGSGNFVNDRLRRNFRFRFFMNWMDVTLAELERHGDQIVVEKLNRKIEHSRYIDQAVILAMDGVIDTHTGQLDREKTQFFVDNEFVIRETAKYPALLFGASINPLRENSIELLEHYHARGAVLIKWLPSIMHFDPAAKELAPFYRRLAALNLPLLTHTGMEKSFLDANDALADPRRLALALELGVTVIAAHIATTGQSEGEDNFERIMPMFDEYPNLYADISSLTQFNKRGYLAEALRRPGLIRRMTYGTDWPLQYAPLVSAWYHVNHIGLGEAWRISRIDNPFDRDVELKRAFGVPPAVFTRWPGRSGGGQAAEQY